MPAQISPAQQKIVDELPATGQYHSTSGVMDKALKLLRQQSGFRSQLQSGIDQLDRGEGIPAESVYAELLAPIEHPE